MEFAGSSSRSDDTNNGLDKLTNYLATIARRVDGEIGKRSSSAKSGGMSPDSGSGKSISPSEALQSFTYLESLEDDINDMDLDDDDDDEDYDSDDEGGAQGAMRRVRRNIRDTKEKISKLLEMVAEEKRLEGNDKFKKEAYDDALRLYEEALHYTPKNNILYSNKALVLQKLGQHEAAKEAALEALELDPTYLKAFVIALKSCVQLNDVVDGCRLLEEVPEASRGQNDIVDLGNKLAGLAKDQGNAFFKEGKFSEALEYYTMGCEADPKNHLLFSNRCACYQSMKQWQDAINDAQTVISLCPTFSKGHVHLIRSLLQANRVDKAKECYEQAIAILSKSDDWNDQKKTFDDLGAQVDNRVAENKRRAANATVEEKARAERFKTRGNALYKEENYIDAISQYSQAIAACPSEGTYYGNRAAAWMMLKEFNRAINDCTQGLEFEKQPGELNKLRLRRASAYLALGQLDEAMSSLESAPIRDASITAQITTIRNMKNNWVLAKDAADKGEYSRAKRLCLSLQSDGLTDAPKFLLLLCQVHLGLEEFEDASKLGQTVINKMNGAASEMTMDAYRCRADALQGLGLYEQASKHLAAALQLDPDNQKMSSKWKALKACIQEITRARQNFDDAFRERKFEVAINFATDGMQIDKNNKKLLAELHFKRARSYMMLGKTNANATKDAGQSNPFQRAIQDANRAMYYDRDLKDAFYVKMDTYEAWEKYQEGVDELESYMETRIGKEDEDAPKRLKTFKLLLKQSKRKNLYVLLGVEEGKHATDEQIRKAYKKSALKWHPDRHSSSSEEQKKAAEQKFKEIQEAFEILSDAKKRSMWDQGHDIEDINSQSNMEEHHQHGGGHHGFGHGGYGGFGGGRGGFGGGRGGFPGGFHFGDF